jgi:Zn-dependent metalloprotease
MHSQVHSIFCITPPHMLERIAEHGTPRQREWALKTLSTTERFRGQRQISTEFSPLAATRAAEAKLRITYDAEYGSSLPGRVVRSEGEPPVGDPAVDEAHDGAGETYDLYKEVYERDSIDGKGMRIESTVHYQHGYDNAFWNGQQMVYGDGDEDLPENERLFNRFTAAIDIIGHELTHGVTQHEARLIYWDQPGALNESFSDVFGVLVKQRLLGETASEADWLVGAGLFTPNVLGQGIRSMQAPGTAYDDPLLGKDPQPGHMDDYVHTGSDNGGVHINSGIPNRAFCVTALEIGGYAWEKAGQIWYVALKDRLGVRSNFQDAANVTFQVAGDLYGANSLEQQAVVKGWAAVGLGITETEKPGCWERVRSLFRR